MEGASEPHGSPASSSSRPKQAAAEYRIRFFNFNLGNNSNFSSLDELQGPGGRGRFQDAVMGPMADGRDADISFATFVETRLPMRTWIRDYLAAHRGSRLDSLLSQNARREGTQNTRSRLRSFVEGLAASYNGNLKSLLLFSSGEFKEDPNSKVFGRLTEATIAGLPVPNPKKAFMGRSVVGQRGEDIRFSFVGAHFPIAKLASALEDPTVDPLHGAKIALARTLRKVLLKANRRQLTDEKTVIFVQGDLNSRTVLRGTEVHDALLELLDDDAMQAAIMHELELPPGRWREVVPYSSVNDLPVTYKFHLNLACSTFDDELGPSGGDSSETGSPCSPSTLTIGHVIASARRSAEQSASSATDNDIKPPERKTSKPSSASLRSAQSGGSSDIYRRTMTDLGPDRLANWGVVFKQDHFRAFRFPACADRVIYWAADSLADRLSWELPRGGYEVNHAQLGSDHRPVSLEVVLRLAPAALRTSRNLAFATCGLVEGVVSPSENELPDLEDEGLVSEDDELQGRQSLPEDQMKRTGSCAMFISSV